MKGYIIVSVEEDKEVITGWKSSLKEAQKETRDGDTIFEVTGSWDARPAMELDKKDLKDIFG
jgi:hypothetical protein